MRLNRPFTPTSSDNASVGLDFAFLTYTFGKEHQWEMRIGRAYGMIGSYELDINPLYEYYLLRPSELCCQWFCNCAASRVQNQITDIR